MHPCIAMFLASLAGASFDQVHAVKLFIDGQFNLRGTGPSDGAGAASADDAKRQNVRAVGF